MSCGVSVSVSVNVSSGVVHELVVCVSVCVREGVSMCIDEGGSSGMSPAIACAAWAHELAECECECEVSVNVLGRMSCSRRRVSSVN